MSECTAEVLRRRASTESSPGAAKKLGNLGKQCIYVIVFEVLEFLSVGGLEIATTHCK